MIPYLKRFSGTLFYLLGGSFFIAYMLHFNQISPWASWWMKVADLPLALVGVLYGGSSLYSSVKPKNGDSASLMIILGIPLLATFAFLVVLNFWPILVK